MLHLLPILAPSCPGLKRSTRHDLRDSLRDSWRGGWGSDITDDAGLELYQQIGPPRRGCLAFVEPSACSPRTRSSPPSCSFRRLRCTRRAAAEEEEAEAAAEAEADPRRGSSACRSSAGGATWTKLVFPAGTTPSRISGPGRGPPGRGRRRRSSTRRRSATWKAVPQSPRDRRGIMLLVAI